MYFPESFSDMERLEGLDKLRKRTLALLKCIIDGTLNERNEEIERIDKYFATTYDSKNFNGSASRNVFISIDNSFEDVCFILESNGVHRPKEIPIYEFQRKLSMIKKQTKKPDYDGPQTIHR